MSQEDTPHPKNPPSWFPLPVFVPTTEVLLHAAEMRVAEAQMEAKQANCKRTPGGKLKKGEDVAFYAAEKECDEVFRIHAQPVREWMYQERTKYVREAKRVVFTKFIESATHVSNSPSGIDLALGVRVGYDPHVAENCFDERGNPFFNLTSQNGNTYLFTFRIQEAIIQRVEISKEYKGGYSELLCISHDFWRGVDKPNTKINSVCFHSDSAEGYIELAWLMEASARLCQDLNAFNNKNIYGEWHDWGRLFCKAEKDAIGMTHDDCYVPEPIEKTNDQK